MRVAVIGLGEAGSMYAEGLATSGQDVTGYDPLAHPALDNVTVVESVGECVDGAEVVFSLVGAANAECVVTDLLSHLHSGMVLADLNTSGPDDKRRMARRVVGVGASYLDVAVLAPVPRAGAGTPLMISGDGGDMFRIALQDTGAQIETVGGGVGAAAERKLLRSVFMKGLAGVVIEALDGAKSAGCEDWMRGQIETELAADPAQLVERLVTGSQVHAARRKHEAADAARCLDELGTHSWMTRGVEEWFEELEKRSAG
ncbi:NAD(P)-binding domain-containing protein [Brachybacterium tyrofermentans]|uniref:NAD(P)-binding domain-containing protein n=1 Tax=Brachybacterium tyrofermentans TaxID=47848 RepID=UPI003FD69B1F